MKDPEASNTAHDTMSTMTAPEVGEVAAQNDVSTISASEVPDMETARNPPGTINPSAEEAHINAGNLAVMKCYVSNDALFLKATSFLEICTIDIGCPEAAVP